MVNWTTKEAYAKLLAAVYAAHRGVKFNFNDIAHFYGDGATYDAIEGRFRIIKKEAKILRDGAGDPQSSTSKRKRASSQQSVLSGRVTKRGTKGKKVKNERGESEAEDTPAGKRGEEMGCEEEDEES
jgi:hypothetical protein